jgi:hypothetical protein
MAISHVKSNTIADMTGTVTVGNSTGGTKTVAATDLVRPSDWNSVHNNYSTLVGNTAGASTVSGSNIIMSGGNNITLSVDGASVGIVGRSFDFASQWTNVNSVLYGTQTQQALQSTFVVIPLRGVDEVRGSVVRMLWSIVNASSTFASTANTTFSYNQAETHNYLLYTRGGGTDNSAIYSVWSTGLFLTWSVNVAYGSASNTSQTNSFGLTYYNSANTSTTWSTSITTSNTSQILIRSNNNANVVGVRYAEVPFTTTLAERQWYWLAAQSSSAVTTQGTNLSGVRYARSHMAVTYPNVALGNIGVATNSSQHFGPGSFTTVGGATTSKIPLSAISSSASHAVAVVMFGVNTSY